MPEGRSVAGEDINELRYFHSSQYPSKLKALLRLSAWWYLRGKVVHLLTLLSHCDSFHLASLMSTLDLGTILCDTR